MLLPLSLLVTIGAVAADGVISPNLSGKYTIGPNYTADPATQPCVVNCRETGNIIRLTMPFANSTYNCNPEDQPKCGADGGYCGQTMTPNNGELGMRNITVYIPSKYSTNSNDELGVMVLQDGELFFSNIVNILDNLIDSEDEDRSLPAFALVAIEVAGSPGMASGANFECVDGPGSERYHEYQTVSAEYAEFVSKEVLPFVTAHPNIKKQYPNFKFTNDPAGRAAFGASSGGAAAFKMAFFSPELFGISIGYSSAIVNVPGGNLTSDSKYPLRMGEMYIRKPEGQELINSETKKNIRIFHSAGENDVGTPNACTPDGSPGGPDNPSYLEAHEQIEKDLVAKGYETRYAYAQKGCHADSGVTFQDLPNTLVWAWADWKKKVDQTKEADQQTVEVLEEQPSSSVRPRFSGAISIVSAVVIFYYVY